MVTGEAIERIERLPCARCALIGTRCTPYGAHLKLVEEKCAECIDAECIDSEWIGGCVRDYAECGVGRSKSCLIRRRYMSIRQL